jgi:hypothetical protein
MINLQEFIYYVVVGSAVATIVFCFVRDVYGIICDVLVFLFGLVASGFMKIIRFLGSPVLRLLDTYVLPKLTRIFHLNRQTTAFSVSDLLQSMTRSFKKK